MTFILATPAGRTGSRTGRIAPAIRATSGWANGARWRVPVQRARLASLAMQQRQPQQEEQDPPPSEPVPDRAGFDGATNDEQLMEEEEKTRASQAAAERVIQQTQRTGVTRDGDGKSNVWAVEPAVYTESHDEGERKRFLPLLIAALVVLAMVTIRFLPLTNPDQV